MENRYVKVPMVMQMEEVECGAACLSMIYGYYGKWIPLARMRTECGISRDGSNALRLVTAARNQGMKAAGYRYETEDLKRVPCPCILHWNFNHFVVFCGFKKGKAVINDPARGTREIAWEELDRCFTGVCLSLCPGDGFKQEGKPPSVLEFVRRRLKGAGPSLVYCAMGVGIFTIVGIVNPVMNQVFIDRILSGASDQWLLPFLAILTAITASRLLVMTSVNLQSLKITGKFALIANCEYIWHVLHLPMEFFAQRGVGDINSRKEDNESVVDILLGTLAPVAINGVMLIVYLLMMLRYSVLLTVIGVLSVFLNTGISYSVSKKKVAISQVKMRNLGKLSSVTVSGMSMMETIKASGSEDGFFGKWAGYQAALNTAHAGTIKMERIYSTVPYVVSLMTNITIQVIGVYMIIAGEFTIGMLMAFQGFLSGFSSPAENLITSGTSIQEMRTNMERIDDVMNYEADTREGTGEEGEAQYRKLAGTVELSHVTFGYNKLAKPLIKDFSLTIRQGERIALVGSSGCGKSTLSKLISGLYRPWEGEIRIGGKTHDEIPRDVLTGSLAVVDQDIILFDDTVAGNIKMWDTSIEDFEMILAAKDAQIHDDLMKREDGYNTRILEHGRNFSGGQRQRLEIARVLAGDPTIIIMDEATSALDARTEHDVVKAIQNRGITCIIVAHRLSTIRDCNKILVLDQGLVVEQGTHEELMQRDGYYKRLVTTE